jgi:hypothetical protein
MEEVVREKQGPNLQELQRFDPFVTPLWWKVPGIYIKEV